MKTHDAIKFFRTQTELAKALSTGQSTVASWGEFPPALRQLQLEALTGGALKAEKNILPRKKSQRQGLNNSFDSAKVKSIAGHA